MRTKLPAARIDALRRVSLFNGCSDKELAHIDAIVDEHWYPAGSTLMFEGEPGRESFVIVDGCADVHVGGQRVNQLGPGDLVGEMAVLDHEVRSATVRARTDVKALVLTPRELRELLTNERLARAAVHQIGERLRTANAAAQAATLDLTE